MPPRSDIEVSSPPLAPAVSREEYELHASALEWSLADPIVLESEEDIQSKPQWRDGFEPFHHQVTNLVTFCKNLPVMLLADDVGLGKTISAALILSELMKRRRVSRTLVLCPKILCPQWVEELESKVGVFGRVAYGSDLDSELKNSAPVVVSTYHSALSRLRRIGPGDFDMLILDEAHKLRNLHGANNNPPKIATELRRVLAQRQFKFVLMLTATPMQNRLWDLYSLVDLLTVAKGHRNPLGTPNQFSTRFLADRQTGRTIRPDTRDEFRRIFRQYVQRTRRVTARLPFPERDVKMFSVRSTPAERKLLDLLRSGMSRGNALAKTTLATALMSSPAAFVAQLENMAQRDKFYAGLASKARTIASSHKGLFAKEERLLELIAQLRKLRSKNWRLVVFTTRRETQATLGRLLTQQGVSHGFIAGGEAVRNQQTIEAFMADPPRASVVVSTDAGAEGVNLQKCNVLVNYDLPWNPMIVEQRIGRVQRLRSPHKFVTVVNLCLADSPEQHVVGRLMEKLQTISQTVGDIEAILESNFGSSKDLEKSFRDQVLRLVMSSLEGQDVEKATQQAERSILDGKRLLQEQQEDIDNQFGDLDELQSAGPRPPKLSRSRPSKPYREFALGTLVAEGGYEIQGEGELVEVSLPSCRVERWAFDEATYRRHVQPGHFAGLAPKLYVPGRPDFERLVQHWIDRSALYLEVDRQAAEGLTRAWFQENADVRVESCAFTPDSIRVRGVATVKAAATNAVDSYEKLLRLEVESDEEREPPARDQPRSLQSFAPHVVEQVRRMVAEDPDIKAFREFYTARLEEEREKAGSTAQLRKKVEDDFDPAVHCEVVGFEGQTRSVGWVEVTYSVDGSEEFVTRLRVAPEADGVLDYPAIGRCEETSHRVPADALDRCEVTGKLVLQHLLAVSDETQTRGLVRLLVRCAKSGRTAFPDELGLCVVTGLRVSPSLLIPSELSGELALAEAMVKCEFTGAVLLPAEVETSQVSGRTFRIDQRAVSAASLVSGHQSELVTCEESGELILPDESERSDFSGKRVWRDLLVTSARPPYRRGLEGETVVCAASGKKLLSDETAASDASGLVVDSDLLMSSDSGAGKALAEELVTCGYSGQRLLPQELSVSESSGRRVRKSALVSCAVTGKRVSPDETSVCEFTGAVALADQLRVSDLSARRYRLDQETVSEVSGKRGHSSEFDLCEYSGAIATPDELAESDLTRKRCLVHLLEASEKSGRRGYADAGELVTCTESGKRLLADEAAQSDVSGKLVDKDLLVESASGAGRALESELVGCEHSGRQLLPQELVASAESGRRVERAVAVESGVSGKLAAPDEVEVCSFTGVTALPSELATSDVSGKRYRGDERARSSVSGRSGHRSEFRACDYTGVLATPEELKRSDLTGKWCLAELLQSSEKSGRFGATPSGELVVCETSGRRLLSDETGKSDVSGKLVDKDLLVESASGAGRALQEELQSCECSGRQLLPIELVASDLSGRRIEEASLVVSAVSGKRVAPDEASACEVTGAIALPEELAESELSGKRYRVDQQAKSEVSGRTGHASEFSKCEYSGKRAAPDELVASELSGRRVCRDSLVVSAVSGKRVAPDEASACEVTGAVALPEELAESELSGKRYRIDQQAKSEVSGRTGHASEFSRCEYSGKRAAPDELGHSDASGKACVKTLLVASQKSGRFGVEQCDEVQRCEASGRKLLTDELSRSDVSGKLVNTGLLVASDSGMGRALANELATCAKTGRRLLPTEIFVSELSGATFDRGLRVVSAVSGKPLAEHEAARCEFTGVTTAPAELRRSEVSGKRYRTDQQADSEVSRRLGHASEFTSCEFTGRRAAMDELRKSEFSGRLAIRELLVESAVSGRLGVEQAGELVRCDATAELLMADEVDVSQVSGRRVDRRLLHRSAASGVVAAEDEMVRCAQSRVWLLPEEVEKCSQTGEAYDSRLMASSHSGKRGLRKLLRRCAMTGQLAFEDELGVCAVTGRSVLIGKLVPCQVTGKLAAVDRLARSPASGRIVLREVLVKTEPNGLVCAKDEAVRCPWTGYLAAEAETFVCQWTGLRMSNSASSNGEWLEALERLLASRESGESGAPLADWLAKQLNGSFSGLKRVRYVRSPSRSFYAVVCDLSQMFGARRRVGAFVLRVKGEEKEIVGKATFFKVRGTQTVVVKQVDAPDPTNNRV